MAVAPITLLLEPHLLAAVLVGIERLTVLLELSTPEVVEVEAVAQYQEAQLIPAAQAALALSSLKYLTT